MRVTDAMISNRVVFNMQRSLRRFFDLETQMSSGRRINRPADDPAGTLRDLDYRAELSRIEQYQQNIGQGLNWNGTYDQVLNDVSNLLTQAKEIAIAMANDTYDDIAREAASSQVRSIVDQVISLANTELEQRNIFSGHRTKTTPFTLGANGAVYHGNQGDIEFEIDSGQRAVINLPGSNVFLRQIAIPGENADLDVGISAATLLANLHNGDGIDLASGFTITDRNMGFSATVDLSDPAIVTVQDAIDAINTQMLAAAPPVDWVTARLGDEGNNITFDTTASSFLSGVTRLEQLNSGAGIELEPGTMTVTTDTGVGIEVDLSGAQTIDDVINAFNNTMAAESAAHPELANVSMSLSFPMPTGLQIIDTNVPPVGVTIANPPDGAPLATQLGIEGDVNALLVGQDLNPQPSFEITENGGTTAADLGVLAGFTHDLAGDDLDALLTTVDGLDLLYGGRGIDQNEIVIWQGDTHLTIDLDDPTLVTVQDLLDRINGSHLNVSASLNDSATGIQIANDDPARSLVIEEFTPGSGARDLGIFGSSDMIGSLLILQNSLDADDREGSERMVGFLEDAIQGALDIRGQVGSRMQRLETTNTRLVDSHLSFTRLLSEVEDADITEVLTQLSTHETSYQAALMATAKIIQPSLMNFLSR